MNFPVMQLVRSEVIGGKLAVSANEVYDFANSFSCCSSSQMPPQYIAQYLILNGRSKPALFSHFSFHVFIFIFNISKVAGFLANILFQCPRLCSNCSHGSYQCIQDFYCFHLRKAVLFTKGKLHIMCYLHLYFFLKYLVLIRFFIRTVPTHEQKTVEIILG
jgi:hypothetical protein